MKLTTRINSPQILSSSWYETNYPNQFHHKSWADDRTSSWWPTLPLVSSNWVIMIWN